MNGHSALRRSQNTLKKKLPNSGRTKPMVSTVLISLERSLTTTKKLRRKFMKSMVGSTNIMKNVVISAFQAMSDAKVTTQENVLLNVTAALNITFIVATIPTITQQVITTMLQEKENISTAMTGAAQKITPTAKEIVFLMPPASHMVMDLIPPNMTIMTSLWTTLKFVVKVRDVVNTGRPISNISPLTNHSAAFLTNL